MVRDVTRQLHTQSSHIMPNAVLAAEVLIRAVQSAVAEVAALFVSSTPPKWLLGLPPWSLPSPIYSIFLSFQFSAV